MYAGRKKPGVWQPAHTEPLLQTGSTDRVANLTPLAGCKAAQSTCTGLKLACLSYNDHLLEQMRSAQRFLDPTSRSRNRNDYPALLYEQDRPYVEKYCNFTWEQCMNTGWWEGYALHRTAERR
jgi:hypothetical protein